MAMQQLSPLLPGEFIRQAYLVHLDMTLDQAARALDIQLSSLSLLLEGKSDINADMTLRLESVSGCSH